ncbi:MAG: hypothetical protein ACFE96_02355 [Candidatus Hermodarchaeota archaeon]
MRNYNKALLIVAILIVGGGVAFFAYGFSTRGSIEDSFTFTYEPVSPDPIQDLNVNVDIGEITFQYNTTPTSSYVQIDVFIQITGLFMQGKTYQNFFDPHSEWWDNSTGTFSLLTIPDIWFDPSHWFKSYNISVIITLRTDVIYDITALSSTGSIEMEVYQNTTLDRLLLTSSTGSVKLKTMGYNTFLRNVRLVTSTGSIESFATRTNFSSGFYAETSTGSSTLNFTSCIMGDNLIGTVSTGDINFKSYNMLYSKDIDLNLDTSTGSIDVDLYQYISMGANVSGIWETSTGSVDVFYRDTLVDTDVRFVGSTGTGSINYTPHATMEITGLGSVYSTSNYGDGMYRYLFSLDTSTGSINANAQSD